MVVKEEEEGSQCLAAVPGFCQLEGGAVTICGTPEDIRKICFPPARIITHLVDISTRRNMDFPENLGKEFGGDGTATHACFSSVVLQ